MKRLIVHEARVIHIAWVESQDKFEFRLLYGKQFLTPTLWLTPDAWQKLFAWGTIVLSDFKGEEWLSLNREGRVMTITPHRKFDYGCGVSFERGTWPKVEFQDLYQLAKEERGGVLSQNRPLI